MIFLLGLPFLAWGRAALLARAGAWVVAGPVASQLVRPRLPRAQFASPALRPAGTPRRLLSELLFTGYYPCAPWLAFLLLA